MRTRVFLLLALTSIFALANIVFTSTEALAESPKSETSTLKPKAPFKILNYTPQAKSSDLVIGRRDIRPTIVFSHPLIELGQKEPKFKGQISPNVPGRWHFLGSDTVEFIPETKLDRSTIYTVTIPNTVTDLWGTPLQKEVSFQFQTTQISCAIAPEFSYEYLDKKSHSSKKPFIELNCTEEPNLKSLKKHLLLTQNGKSKQNSISLEVIKTDFSEEIQNFTVILQPTKELESNQAYTVKLTAGLQSNQGPVASKITHQNQLFTLADPKFIRIACSPSNSIEIQNCSQGGFILSFTQSVNPEELLKSVKIIPEVKDLSFTRNFYRPYKTARNDSQANQSKEYDYNLFGKLTPNTEYALEITSLTEELSGSPIPDVKISFKTDNHYPEFETIHNESFLIEAKHPLPVPVESVSLENLRLFTQTPTIKQLVLSELFDNKNWPRTLPYKNLKLNNVSEIEPNHTDVSIEPFNSEFGVISYELFHPKTLHKYYNFRNLVQITDLGIEAKFSKGTKRVFVWQLSTGKPVEGAQIELWSQLEGKPILLSSNVITDKNGMATLPTAQEGLTENGYMAIARLGDDMAFTSFFENPPLEDGGYHLIYQGKREYQHHESSLARNLLFTDRGIYQPGEEIHVKGILRNYENGEYKPNTENVTLEILLPKEDWRKPTTQTVKMSEFGTFETTIQLKDDVPLGDVQLTLFSQSHTFLLSTSVQIAEFHEPTFAISLEANQKTVLSGEEISADLNARNLIGSSMSNAEVSSIWRWHTRQQTRNYKRLYWGYDSAFFQNHNCEKNAQGQIKGATIKLDDNGHTTLSYKAVTEKCAQTFELEATVSDVDRHKQSANVAFDVFPTDLQLFLGTSTEKKANFSYRSGEPFKVYAISVDSFDQESLIASKDVEITLQKQDSEDDQKFNELETCTLNTRSGKKLSELKKQDLNEYLAQSESCSFTINDSNPESIYRLFAKSTDRQGRTAEASVHLAHEGHIRHFNSHEFQGTEKLNITFDKDTYNVGDVAQITISSPFNNAETWFTVEHSDILSERRFKLTKNSEIIEVPITNEMIPNVYVSVNVVRGRVETETTQGDPGRPKSLIASKLLKVLPTQKTLNIVLNAPDHVTPGSELNFDLQVTDFKGEGIESEVTIWAVHEGVLNLTDYQAPTHDWFFQTQPNIISYKGNLRLLSEMNVEDLHQFAPQLQHAIKYRKSDLKGGRAQMLNFATAKAAPALFNAVEVEDMKAEMSSTADATLYENSENFSIRKDFKITAFFLSNVKTDSNGQSHVHLKLPDNITTYKLMAIAVDKTDKVGSTQKNLLINQEISARIALPRSVREGDRFTAGIILDSLNKEEVDVEVSAQISGDLIALEPLSRKVHVGKAGEEVRFEFEVPVIQRDNTSTTLQFFVKSELGTDAIEHKLAITRSVPLETFTLYGLTNSQDMQAIHVPADIHTNKGGLEVTLSQTILAGLAEDAQNLIEYPYDCLEQRASRLVPLALMQKILKRYNHELENESEISAIIRKNINEIAKLQAENGGFKYWPNSRKPSYYATAWAVFALGLLERNGYSIQPVNLTAAEKYLQTNTQHLWSGEIALAAFALSENRQPLGKLAGLLNRNDYTSSFAQALIAHVISKSNIEKSNAILTKIFNNARIEADRITIVDQDNSGTYFYSQDRATAAALLASLRISPDHPFVTRLARQLISHRHGKGFQNTHESAFALLALNEYSKKFESKGSDFIAKSFLGEKEIASVNFTAQSDESQTITLSWSDIALAQSTPLNFTVEPENRLYYSARLRYAPIAELPAVDNGFTVERWYTHEDGTIAESATEGENLRVHLKFSTHKPRDYVVINDPMPSGLESQDPSLKGSRRDDLTHGSWIFDHTEFRNDRVLLFADRMSPGEHHFEYTVRAITPGTFKLAPVTIEEMYNPEVYGRTHTGTFKIHAKEK